MDGRSEGRRRIVATVLAGAFLAATAAAEPRLPVPAAPLPPLRLDAPAPAEDELAHGRIGGPASAAEASRVRVLELAAQGPPGSAPRRAHHALSIRSDAPRSMLRSIGVPASDCATRVRMPSSLHQTSSGADLEVQAQVGLSCRF
jgi:hypothetical protein